MYVQAKLRGFPSDERDVEGEEGISLLLETLASCEAERVPLVNPHRFSFFGVTRPFRVEELMSKDEVHSRQPSICGMPIRSVFGQWQIGQLLSSSPFTCVSIDLLWVSIWT